jgi:hypothetical protein
MAVRESIALLYDITGLGAITSPWLRTLVVYAFTGVYFLVIAAVCLLVLPRQRPPRPLAGPKVLLFFFLFALPALCVGFLLPFWLSTFDVERQLIDSWPYTAWWGFLFLASYLPGIVLLWRRFRQYDV